MATVTHADQIVFQRSDLTQAHTVNHYHVDSDGQDIPEILKGNVAFDALYNSDARFDPPKCHPRTRTAVLDHLNRWVHETECRFPVMWLRGVAGAGKSAIAQTLAERWDEDGILAGAFFFSHTISGLSEKRSLIPTLVYQLCVSLPSIRPFIAKEVRLDGAIFRKNLQTQMKTLVIGPLEAVSSSEAGEINSIPLKVIIIDGLDECCTDYPQQDHESQQKEILDSISYAIGHPNFPLRFLISSRPERQIRESFCFDGLKDVSSVLVLDITQNPDADIELFARCTFDEIRQRHPYLPKPWPPDDVIPTLVRKSSGHFIYVAVVLRYISSPRGNPEISLAIVMGLTPAEGGANPFTELDALYSHILRSVVSQSLSTVKSIFEVMLYGNFSSKVDYVLFDQSIRPRSPIYLTKYLFLSLGQIYQHLIDLHSILEIPVQDDAGDVPISFIHASFSEYLTDPARSGDYFIGRHEAYTRLLPICLKHLILQVLTEDGGEGMQYFSNGFAFLIGQCLEDITHHPSSETLEGLATLVDEDEERFVRYVRTRAIVADEIVEFKRNDEIILQLYQATYFRKGVPHVLVYLKERHLGGFTPIVPPSLSKNKLVMKNYIYSESPTPKETPPSPIRHRRRTFITWPRFLSR